MFSCSYHLYSNCIIQGFTWDGGRYVPKILILNRAENLGLWTFSVFDYSIRVAN